VSQADLDVLWRLAPGQALVHRSWDGETLLFNDLSGDTHLLDGNAMAVLLALQGGPLHESALSGAVGASGYPGTPEGRDALANLLADLEILSLIQALC
jgi:PqqD family protein of HPr-rel-A system